MSCTTSSCLQMRSPSSILPSRRRSLVPELQVLPMGDPVKRKEDAVSLPNPRRKCRIDDEDLARVEEIAWGMSFHHHVNSWRR